MMHRLHKLPIHKRLTLIVLLTCGSLVMLMAVLFMADKFFSFRGNLVANMATLAEVIGQNSTAALTFDDSATGEEILSAIKAEPNVSAACIYRPDGRKFAAYSKFPNQKPGDLALINGLIKRIRRMDDARVHVYEFSMHQFILARPVVMDHRLIGIVVIRASLRQLYNRLALSGLLVAGVVIVLVMMAQMITTRLHRSISDPLSALVSTMNRVTAQKNYALRADHQGDGELGILITGFNDMLSRIQQRDQQLEQHRHHLEEQVVQRTRELVGSHEKLKQEMEERKQMQDQLARYQRMEAVGTLAAGVAHDLNNILSGVVSYPDLLLMRLPEDSDLRKPLTTIQNSGQKAAAIVQDLLTLARRGVTTSEVVDLRETAEDYLTSPEHEQLLSFHPGVHVKHQFDPDLMNIVGSPVHLGKTIMNLVSNAAEAIHGKGEIVISLRNVYIDTPVRGYDEVKEGDYVLLKVSDTGHGIAARDLQRIFEPFYTKKKMGRSGTGLGMAVVWGTVKDHQGYIDVESRETKGTTFSLYFPVTRKQLSPQVPLPLREFMGQGQTILVVDDMEDQREIASDILETLGYTVNSVGSGEAALAYLEHKHTDLLLLDMIMEPGIDGMETYQRIVSRHGQQRAIIASGYSESERVKKAQAMGAGCYLRKPYTIENLAQAVYNELHGIDEPAN